MGIGERIAEWWAKIDTVATLKKWFDGVRSRWPDVVNRAEAEWWNTLRYGGLLGFLGWFNDLMFQLWGGVSFLKDPEQLLRIWGDPTEVDRFLADPSEYIASKLEQIGQNPTTREITESLGSLVTDPVISLFESYATHPDPDAKEFARAFHGLVGSLGWSGKIIDATLKPILGDRAPNFSELIMQTYWNLGIGFLGWQTLAPLLSSGLQPNLERHNNRLYRPQRFSPSQLQDLLAIGRLTPSDLIETLKDLGWRDDDIDLWVELSYRQISEGTGWELYHNGQISQGRMETLLRAHGYNPDDIPLLFLANEKTDSQDAGKFLLSTAKNSLKDKLITEAEFRQILKDNGYAPREIDLQVQLIQTQQEVEQRDLSTSQVQALYNNRIIGQSETIHNLETLGYPTVTANQLVTLWDTQNVPKAARINRTTITEAYANGVLSRNEAKAKLISEAGYSSDNAELILKVEDAQAANAPGAVTVGAAALSLSQLREFVDNGLMTVAEFEARPELERFTPQDRQTLATLYFQVTPNIPPELSDSVLANAYIFGIVSRTELEQRLAAKGLAAADIQTFIRLVELDNPEVFGEFTGRYIKNPTPSQLQLALQRGLIDEQQFRGHLERQGFSLDAVEIYLFNAQYQAPAEPKELTKSDIISLYGNGKLSKQNALQRLVRLGYTIDDATLLVEKVELLPEDTEIGQALLGGYIDAGNALLLLGEMGFSPEDLDAFAARFEQGLI